MASLYSLLVRLQNEHFVLFIFTPCFDRVWEALGKVFGKQPNSDKDSSVPVDPHAFCPFHAASRETHRIRCVA